MKGDFEKIIETTVPLSTTQKEQIVAIRQWANVRAVSATSTTNKTEYQKESDDENPQDEKRDVSRARGGRTLDF